ncbi:hypothetical protein [Parendozoicomonas sp. Alg238-R29]|uniref:hypothetical protein n=1 Tax=Parendozoicomonas sp. Alg238-R29 TaxID=2993446 RepID=UPI00248EC7D7|nr:hypothetical protein [Parendozoicomonas sp. Alg238-R29]
MFLKNVPRVCALLTPVALMSLSASSANAGEAYDHAEQAFVSGEQVKGFIDIGACELLKSKPKSDGKEEWSFAFSLGHSQIVKVYHQDGDPNKVTYKLRQHDFLMTAPGKEPGRYFREVDISADGSVGVTIKENKWQGTWSCPEGALSFPSNVD